MALIPSESAFSYAIHQWEFNVFLSCRGRDVFVDHLYAALRQKGITTFIDDDKILTRGEPLFSELFEGVEKSRISVIIISEYYASSAECLDELEKILKCQKKRGKIVIPVFHGVSPYNVRYQKGSFEEVFAKHEEFFKENLEKVDTWRAALNEVGDISGWNSEDISSLSYYQPHFF